MDVDKVYKLFAIAEQAPKFPDMSGKVLEWVRLQLIDVDKEITQEIEMFKAKVQADADERSKVAQAKKAKQDKDKLVSVAKTVDDDADGVRRL